MKRVPVGHADNRKSHKWSDPFYRGKRWRRLRWLALQRDKGLCAICHRHGIIRAAIDVDHIKERKKYPRLEYSLDNLQSLCKACHTRKGIADRSGRSALCVHGYPYGECCK